MHLSRKGITSILMTLILSAIVVSLLFLGVFYSYKSLAKDMGVKFSLDSLKQKPTFSYKGYLEIRSITQFVTNSSKCSDNCLNQNCKTSGGSYDSACTQKCSHYCKLEYPNGLNYSVWDISYTYHGYVESPIGVDLYEDQSGLGVGKNVYSNSSEETLPEMDGSFNVKLKIYPNCKSNITINLTAIDDPNVKPATNTSTYDFCVGLPVRDVDVAVGNVFNVKDSSTSSYKISSNVSITGKDVPKLCPSADVYFFMLNNSNGRQLPVLSSAGDMYYASVDTNRSNSPMHWFDLDEFYRVGFNLTNDLPFDIDLSNPETADVVLDISPSRLGYETNLTPEDVINSTAIVSADADQTSVVALDRNVTILDTDANGYVTKFRVEFVLDGSKIGDVVNNKCGNGDSNFTKGCTLNFYAYLNKTTTEMYSQFDTAQYYPVYNVDLYNGNFYRTCYHNSSGDVLGTDCDSCSDVVVNNNALGICNFNLSERCCNGVYHSGDNCVECISHVHTFNSNKQIYKMYYSRVLNGLVVLNNGTIYVKDGDTFREVYNGSGDGFYVFSIVDCRVNNSLYNHLCALVTDYNNPCNSPSSGGDPFNSSSIVVFDYDGTNLFVNTTYKLNCVTAYYDLKFYDLFRSMYNVLMEVGTDYKDNSAPEKVYTINLNTGHIYSCEPYVNCGSSDSKSHNHYITEVMYNNNANAVYYLGETQCDSNYRNASILIVGSGDPLCGDGNWKVLNNIASNGKKMKTVGTSGGSLGWRNNFNYFDGFIYANSYDIDGHYGWTLVDGNGDSYYVPKTGVYDVVYGNSIHNLSVTKYVFNRNISAPDWYWTVYEPKPRSSSMPQDIFNDFFSKVIFKFYTKVNITGNVYYIGSGYESFAYSPDESLSKIYLTGSKIGSTYTDSLFTIDLNNLYSNGNWTYTVDFGKEVNILKIDVGQYYGDCNIVGPPVPDIPSVSPNLSYKNYSATSWSASTNKSEIILGTASSPFVTHKLNIKVDFNRTEDCYGNPTTPILKSMSITTYPRLHGEQTDYFVGQCWPMLDKTVTYTTALSHVKDSCTQSNLMCSEPCVLAAEFLNSTTYDENNHLNDINYTTTTFCWRGS